MSSLQQNWRKGQNRFCLEAREVGGEGGGKGQVGEMTQTMYVHMNKEKKIAKKKRKEKREKVYGMKVLEIIMREHTKICAEKGKTVRKDKNKI
jgi:hypothetical protein